MKSDVTVHLDKSAFVSGDVISGSVNVTLTQDVKIKELYVRIVGQSRVSWSEQKVYIKGGAPSVNHKDSETYIDHGITLLSQDSADDGVFVPPGEHVFRFEYALPHNLPSSYDGRWGQIRYCAKCVLQRPWKFSVEREVEFKFLAITDLNEEPELVKPIGALGEFRPGMFCINPGFVNVEVRLGRRGYVPGETVPVRVEIENNTCHKLHGIRLTLQQHIVFRIGKKMKKLSHTLAVVSKGEVTGNDVAVWENETLKVPEDTPPTSSKSVRSISIKYTVTLHIEHSSWREEYTLPVVIIIGTEPFRKGFIHNYLTVCGYCPTPKASPSSSPRTRKQLTNCKHESAKTGLGADFQRNSPSSRPPTGI